MRRKTDDGRNMNVVRYAILFLALALTVSGILNGGAEDVLTKAVNICMECIGLG